MDVKVSTQTFLAYTNIDDLNLEKLFDEITLTTELIYMSYKRKEVGEKGKKKSKLRNFSNCISFSFFFNEKKINLKLFKNGVIQLTGYKSYEHCEKSLVFLWVVLKETPSCSLLNNLKAYLVSVMRNVVFNLGFPVDREKLEKNFVENKEYNLTMTNGGFIGVRFNKPIESINDMPVYALDISGKDNTVSLKGEITYEKFCDLILLAKNRITKQTTCERTEKYDVITVFKSGKIMFSGVHEKYQDPSVKWFLDTIFRIKDKIVMEEPPVCSLKDYLPPYKKKYFKKYFF